MPNIKELFLRKFNYVMPAVYADALSYPELLYKVLFKQDEIIDQLNENTEDIEENKITSEGATEGQVLTADGDGGYSWEDQTGGTAITVDSSMSSTSENPVQNKVIYTALAGKASNNVAYSEEIDAVSPSGGGTVRVLGSVDLNGAGQVETCNFKDITFPSYSDKADVDVFAPEYSTSTYYNVGDYCTRNGMLYRCTSSTHGSWNSSKWTSVDVGEELQLKADDWAIVRDDTTSTASPSAGGTFTAIDSVTTDLHGCVTGVNTKTVTLPSGGGGSVTVDSAMSSSSTNPVQNKIIYEALSGKANKYYQYTNIYYNNETGYLVFENADGLEVFSVDLISYFASASVSRSDSVSAIISSDFDVVERVTTNSAGQVTSVKTTSVTIPTATTSMKGLMSATDKANLDAVVADYQSAITALG